MKAELAKCAWATDLQSKLSYTSICWKDQLQQPPARNRVFCERAAPVEGNHETDCQGQQQPLCSAEMSPQRTHLTQDQILQPLAGSAEPWNSVMAFI